MELENNRLLPLTEILTGRQYTDWKAECCLYESVMHYYVTVVITYERGLLRMEKCTFLIGRWGGVLKGLILICNNLIIPYETYQKESLKSL